MVQKVASQKKTKPRKEKNQKKNNGMKKTSRGRQKIEIKRIENDSNRQVASSKRRKGLFKKAAEICILTGAELAIIARTESGKISAFGHPSIDGVIQRYLNGVIPSPAPINAELVEEDRRLGSELETEKKKLEALKNANVVNNFWWDEPMDGLGSEELEQRLASLIELRSNVAAAIDELNSQCLGSTDNNAHEMAAFQHCSQIMGAADNGEMKQTANSDGSDMSECYQSLGNIDLGQTTKVDELGLSDYFQFLSNVDLEQTTNTDELFEGSRSQGDTDNVDFATLESEAGFDFCFNLEDCPSFCLDPYGSSEDFYSLPS